MTNILLIVAIVGIVTVVVLQILLLTRKVSLDLSPIQLAGVEQSYERAERAVREEIAKNREEASNNARNSRDELNNALKGFSETLVKTLNEMGGNQRLQLRTLVENPADPEDVKRGLDGSGAVKTEFGKFGDLLKGVKKKLVQASNNIDLAARKSRTIERKLRKVEELPAEQAKVTLMLGADNGDGEIEES